MSGGRLIAVAAEDTRGLEGRVSAHFGRCPFYVLVEANGGTVIGFQIVVANPHLGSHQPGMMPRFINGLGAKVIIAGGMGPRAIELFHGFGIEVVTGAIGTVEEALESYLHGKHRSASPCAGGHEEGCGGRK